MPDTGLMQVAVDAVVFTVRRDQLHLLLIKRKDAPFAHSYAIPGGFVRPDEELEDAARRELEEETNVKDIFLQQLGAYGGVRRDPRGRVLSIAFLALIKANQELRAATDAAEAKWFPIDDLPKLAFDHATIIADALKQLRYELQTTNIAFQILSEKFTLSQLQQLYESVLGKKFDKRNFRKRIKDLDILQETKEQVMGGAHRPAQLYRFASKRYAPIREKVHVLVGN